MSEFTEEMIHRIRNPHYAATRAGVEQALAEHVDSRVRRHLLDEKHGKLVVIVHIGWRWFNPWARSGIRKFYWETLRGELPARVTMKVKFKW